MSVYIGNKYKIIDVFSVCQGIKYVHYLTLAVNIIDKIDKHDTLSNVHQNIYDDQTARLPLSWSLG